MNKNSRRKAKAIILKTDSEEEENDSPSIGANCDSSRRKRIQSTEMKDEEGKAGYYVPYVYSTGSPHKRRVWLFVRMGEY